MALVMVSTIVVIAGLWAQLPCISCTVWSHEQLQKNQSCYVNRGPTCVLGPSPDVYPQHILKMYQENTKRCNKCSPSDRQVGLVCAKDIKNNVYQEMDYCVLLKMNCIGGIAVVQSSGRWGEFGEIPFAIKPRWGRISIRGTENAHIRFYDTWPYKAISSYWVVLSGRWGGLRLMTKLWQDERDPPKVIDNPYALRGAGLWTEYSVVWNKTSGWFLMSQPRWIHWQEHFLLEHVSWPYPRNIKYFDVSGDRGIPLTWILHDLEILRKGRCPRSKLRDNSMMGTEGVRPQD